MDTAAARLSAPAPPRGYALPGAGLILLTLFGLITAGVLVRNPLILDVPLTRALQAVNDGPFGWLMVAVSAPGFAPWNVLVPLILASGIALAGRWRAAAFLLLATIAGGSAELIKNLVQRPRPPATLVHVVQDLSTYSFPSGHVTSYTLVYGFSFYLAWTLLRPGILRTLLLLLSGGLVLLVGPSRIWLGQHWASDVLGGYTLGGGLLLLIIWRYHAGQQHLAPRPAPPDPVA